MPEYDIYLVDDDTKFLFLYESVLSPVGYKIRKFESAKEALAQIVISPPKLLITDLMMPEFNGDELMIKISELKMMNVFIPLMISSAELNENERFEMASLGLDMILSKTITNDQLLQVVADKIEEWDKDNLNK